MSTIDELTEKNIALDIQLEMRRLRGEIREDLDEVASHAKELTDWRYYVKKSPGLSFSLAVATGYLVAPALSNPPANRTSVQTSTQAGTGLGSMAFRIITSAMLRHAVGLVASQLITPARGDSNEALNHQTQFKTERSR